MTSPRNLLLIALLFLGYLLWNAWQEDYARGIVPPGTTTAAPTGTANTPAAPTPGATPAEIPTASNAAPSSPAAAATPTAATPSASPHIVVTTDVLRVEIDTHGGNVAAADLLEYPQQPKDFAHPVRLLDDSASRFFAAQSGLVSSQGVAPDHTATFDAVGAALRVLPLGEIASALIGLAAEGAGPRSRP